MNHENKERYLLLKQNLVLLQLTRLKAVVELNRNRLDVAKCEEIVVKTLVDIEQYFSIPREMIENSPIYLDLCSEAISIEGMLEPVEVDDPRMKHIPRTNDDLSDVIFKFPVFDKYKQAYEENLKNQNYFDQSRKIAGGLVEVTSKAIRIVRRWAEQCQSDPNMSLNQILILVNMIEVIDALFEFTNSTSRRAINAIDNDQSTGC